MRTLPHFSTDDRERRLLCMAAGGPDDAHLETPTPEKEDLSEAAFIKTQKEAEAAATKSTDEASADMELAAEKLESIDTAHMMPDPETEKANDDVRAALSAGGSSDVKKDAVGEQPDSQSVDPAKITNKEEQGEAPPKIPESAPQVPEAPNMAIDEKNNTTSQSTRLTETKETTEISLDAIARLIAADDAGIELFRNIHNKISTNTVTKNELLNGDRIVVGMAVEKFGHERTAEIVALRPKTSAETYQFIRAVLGYGTPINQKPNIPTPSRQETRSSKTSRDDNSLPQHEDTSRQENLAMVRNWRRHPLSHGSNAGQRIETPLRQDPRQEKPPEKRREKKVTVEDIENNAIDTMMKELITDGKYDHLKDNPDAKEAWKQFMETAKLGMNDSVSRHANLALLRTRLEKIDKSTQRMNIYKQNNEFDRTKILKTIPIYLAGPENRSIIIKTPPNDYGKQETIILNPSMNGVFDNDMDPIQAKKWGIFFDIDKTAPGNAYGAKIHFTQPGRFIVDGVIADTVQMRLKSVT